VQERLHFQTDFIYTDRSSKAEYVWRKYEPILRGKRILDVGADERHLARFLDADAEYWGIGLGGSPDQIVDLEKEPLMFEDNSYDTVICLDVLEHIENTHSVFDQLCRIAKEHVIISLPNPWRAFYVMMTTRDYQTGKPLKFYGLPTEKPDDRHKWFFSADEAMRYIRDRATLNNMQLLQIDQMQLNDNRVAGIPNLLRPRYQLRRLAERVLIRNDIHARNFHHGTVWAVLKKEC